MFKKTTITIFLSLIATTAIVFVIARAGELNPSSAPGDTMYTLEDIYCKITNCATSTYGLDSSDEATSTMYTLEEIYDVVFDYSLQKNLIYDDWKGSAAANSTSLAAAYAAGEDQDKEEGEWTAYTDSSLGSEIVASGAVYRDERTGLYWSDCYSSAQDGTCDQITNSFTLDGVVADTDDGLDAEGGNAVDFCESLELDADGDGTDETNWYLPSQKELMQAYINGAANNIPFPAYYYWSSTEYYNNSSYAWYVYLAVGYTSNSTKGVNYYARCVSR